MTTLRPFRFGVIAYHATSKERRERYGISYISVFEDNVEAFAPVVARLAGK